MTATQTRIPGEGDDGGGTTALAMQQTAQQFIERLDTRMEAIRLLMKKYFEEDVHFGKIPGCGEKPSLLKPGAEMISALFALAPVYAIERRDLPGGHIEFQLTCTLIDPSKRSWGQGVGLCSSMESKYRYRGTQVEPTGKPVPRDYWDLRNGGDLKAAQEALGGSEFCAKKVDGEWQICRKTAEKMENPDIADTHNTVLKMAKKRAQVDAALTATAASAFFTQDLDDDDFLSSGRGRDDDPPADKGRKPGNGGRQPADSVDLGRQRAMIVQAFRSYKITLEMLQDFVGKPVGRWTETDLGQLREAYENIKSGAATAEAYFKIERTEDTDEPAPPEGGQAKRPSDTQSGGDPGNLFPRGNGGSRRGHAR